MPNETWAKLPGYEEIYEVSDCGNVRNILSGKVLNGDVSRGYKRVGLYRNGAIRRVMVHRLVLSCFVGSAPTPEHRQANHKNGVKLDNRPENLEWVTPRENSLHAIHVLGTHKQKGSKHGMHKLSESDVLEIIMRSQRQEAIASIAKDFRVTASVISGIAMGKTWRHIHREAQPDRRSLRRTSRTSS